MSSRILLVGQDKGGSGKTVLVRALAECLPGARVIEIEASRRLVEIEDRVDFFAVRADRGAIDKSGGLAARSEFDGPLNAMASVSGPMIVDIGANAAASLLPLIAGAKGRFERRGIGFGLLVVATSEPGALASTASLLALGRPVADALFVVENEVEGAIDPKIVKGWGKDVTPSRLPKLVLDERANALLQRGGLKFIGEDLGAAEANLVETYGFAEAGRIIDDLTGFRLQAMQAASSAARWLEG